MSRVLSSSFLKDPRWTIFEEPFLGFGRGREADIQFPIEGIQKFGPHDYNMRKRRFEKVRILVIHPEDFTNEEQIRQVLDSTVDGKGYYKGFSKEFRLSDEPDIIYEPFEIESADSIADWKKAFRQTTKYSFEHNKPGERTIAIVGGSDHKAFSGTEHYYTTKRMLLKRGVPNQYLSEHTGDTLTGILNQNPSSAGYVYAIWNVALALYTKVGGFPWVLKESSLGTENVDSVAGLRFARDSSKPGFVIGALSVFGRHGTLYGINAQRFIDVTEEGDRWIAKSTGMYVDQENAEQLANMILERHKEKTNGLPNHIVVHRLGRFHDLELSSMAKCFESSKIQRFSFLEIFESGNPRIFKDENGTPQSIRRGLAFETSNNTAMVCTTGDSHYTFLGRAQEKAHYMGTPNPIMVRIRKSHNSFTDPLDAAQNVFNLTALHWGCGWTKEIQLPVTLDFAKRVAKLYAYGVIPHRLLEDTAWFL